MATIKPCPFCGGADVAVHVGTSFRWLVAACMQCGAVGPEIRKMPVDDVPLAERRIIDHEAAIQEWNKRS